MACSTRFSKLLLILSLLFSITICAPTQETSGSPLRGNTLPPEKDPFYSPTPGLEKAKPGEILAKRPVPNAITLNNVDGIKLKSAWQVKFRSQNSVGEPNEGMVTILEPFNAKPDNLFVYHFFSDAAYNGCNPSLALQTGTREDNSFTQLQTYIALAGLSKGWYVSIVDDGGMQAAFGAGLQWGYSNLDSIRAVKQSGNFTGIRDDPTVTLFGYSGGASAAGWTTEMQPSYAPDVRIDGAAIGGLIPNFGILAESLNGVERSRFLPATTLGLAHDYPNMTAWLKENLIPEHEAEFRRAEHQCFDSNNNQYADVDMSKYFKRGYKSMLEDDVPKSVRHWGGTMGLRGTPKTPWYLYQAVGDDASPIRLTDEVYEKHCAGGATILFERNPLPLNHSMNAIAGLGGSFEWLEDIHNRKNNIKPGCQTVGVSEWSLRGIVQLSLARGALPSFFASWSQPVGPSADATGKSNAPFWDFMPMLLSFLPKAGNSSSSNGTKPWVSPLGAVPPSKGGANATNSTKGGATDITRGGVNAKNVMNLWTAMDKLEGRRGPDFWRPRFML